MVVAVDEVNDIPACAACQIFVCPEYLAHVALQFEAARTVVVDLVSDGYIFRLCFHSSAFRLRSSWMTFPICDTRYRNIPHHMKNRIDTTMTVMVRLIIAPGSFPACGSGGRCSIPNRQSHEYHVAYCTCR